MAERDFALDTPPGQWRCRADPRLGDTGGVVDHWRACPPRPLRPGPRPPPEELATAWHSGETQAGLQRGIARLGQRQPRGPPSPQSEGRQARRIAATLDGLTLRPGARATGSQGSRTRNRKCLAGARRRLGDGLPRETNYGRAANCSSEKPLTGARDNKQEGEDDLTRRSSSTCSRFAELPFPAGRAEDHKLKLLVVVRAGEVSPPGAAVAAAVGAVAFAADQRR